MIGFIYALFSAAAYGVMNVLDKYIVAHKVKHALGYAVVTSVANILIAVVFGIFLDWNAVQWSDVFIPAIIGLLYASLLCFYYITLQTEDISDFVALRYFYPVLVALLSFIFLHEILAPIQYIGGALVIAGVLLLSGRIRFAHGKIKYIIIFGIIVTAISDFLVKVTTTHIAPWNGVAVSLLFYGLGCLVVLVMPRVWSETKKEFHNIGWAMLAEGFDFVGIFMLFLAMAALPATIVSSVTAARPLMVLFFEWIAQQWVGQMVKDERFWQKFWATLIVMGVVLMYLTN